MNQKEYNTILELLYDKMISEDPWTHKSNHFKYHEMRDELKKMVNTTDLNLINSGPMITPFCATPSCSD